MSYRVAEVEALFALPFNDLLFKAHSTHRAHFDPNAVQVSTLLSIKTGNARMKRKSVATTMKPGAVSRPR